MPIYDRGTGPGRLYVMLSKARLGREAVGEVREFKEVREFREFRDFREFREGA